MNGSARAPLPTRILAAARESGLPLLDAGRGQPNWIAIAPREAFFLLGRFATEEADASSAGPWGVIPPASGIASRLREHLDGDESAGADLLRSIVDPRSAEFGFEPDALVHDLVVAILGAAYPTPTRFLPRLEAVARRYLERMAGLPDIPGRFEMFATEGGAAAMAYVFKTLRANDIVGPGDAIAIATPSFTPYLQIPVLETYGFRVVPVRSAHNLDHRLTDELFTQLLDPSIKVFFIINPGNPDTRAVTARRLGELAEFVQRRRPDLVIVADTAYATFIDGFRSILGGLPHNTLMIHSFSKNFGATGNRLGFIALHEKNVLDEILGSQPESARTRQQERYSSVTADVPSLSFMARLVAESREVALHNIAGLSTADQVQLTLFALSYLSPEGYVYVAATRAELAHRTAALFAPLGIIPPGGDDSLYYALIDLLQLAQTRHGEPFRAWLEAHVDPETVPLRLAGEHGVIVQPGAFFESEPWDIRVSVASLTVDEQRRIGEAIATVVDDLHSTAGA